MVVFSLDSFIPGDPALMLAGESATPEDIQRYHLILWGDPASNRVISQMIGKLPIKWSDKQIELAGKTFDATAHVPVAMYPNPLNPAKYVVLNSGTTFCEASDHTNAQQNPKLPD